NRREIYALKVKEEIYGAVLNAIMKKDATLKNELEAQIEAAYQQLKTEEAATLMISRRLAEQQYKTKTVPVLPLSEMNTGAAEETSPDSSPEGV
ncbi:MAG TPA: cytoplasmic protein, partial [Enterobacteriaceae bacterium]|nr:cytoplasmic protein [Enterobacteriaceae bacterium]